MTRYLFRRTLEAIPTLFGVTILMFLFVRALPGDPARLYAGLDASPAEVVEARERFGLDSSLPEQFGRYVVGLVQGDLGRSFRSNRPVTDLLARHFPATLVLSAIAIVAALALGIAFGVAAAVRRGSLADLAITLGSILGVSTPSFFLGILLIYVFAVGMRALPVAGSLTPEGLVLPAVTLAAGAVGTIARFVRSSMLEVMGEDFIRTAHAKGLQRGRVLSKHALKNALIPVITIGALQFGFLLSGAVIVETVFNFPGLGWLLIQSIEARDYPVIQALMLVFAVQFVVVNVFADLLYGVVDPRVAYA
ncbi:MAG: ABC transporter permease [Trueperaceae bacterium]|nr:ABC transporter permease [Trueperaceae bacterium]